MYKSVCQASLITNAACYPRDSYAVKATNPPPPSTRPQFVLMVLYIIRGRKWSLEACNNQRKIIKGIVPPLQTRNQYESQKGQGAKVFPKAQVQHERQGSRLRWWFQLIMWEPVRLQGMRLLLSLGLIATCLSRQQLTLNFWEKDEASVGSILYNVHRYTNGARQYISI